MGGKINLPLGDFFYGYEIQSSLEQMRQTPEIGIKNIIPSESLSKHSSFKVSMCLHSNLIVQGWNECFIFSRFQEDEKFVMTAFCSEYNQQSKAYILNEPMTLDYENMKIPTLNL